MILRRVSRLLVNQRAFIRDFPIPPSSKDIIWPPDGERLLPEIPRAPLINPLTDEIQPTTKRVIEIRGPELVHTDFIHKQYGVVAVGAGFMHHEHFEALRRFLNVGMKPKMFAVWRADAPWLARTKLPRGSRMQQAKGKLHHFVTPIRQGRVIVELGGILLPAEARLLLGKIAHLLPVAAQMYSWEELLAEREEERTKELENENPYTWDYVLKWNMQNCSRFVSPYDFIWRGKYR